MAANKEYQELHRLLVQAMKTRLNSDECTAADMNVIRQFLKDNGVEADPEHSDDLKELKQLTDGLPFSNDG